MAYPVNGKDCVLQVYRTDVAAYVPFACAKGMSITTETELGGTTTADSGFSKTFKPTGLGSSVISVNGVLFLRDLAVNKYFALDVVTEQIRLNGLDIKILFTDQGGYVRTITAFVYIPNSVLSGEAGGLGQFSMDLQVSGGITLDDPGIVSAAGITVYSDWWNTTPGGTTISGTGFLHGYSLIGKTVLEIDRSGQNYNIVNIAPVQMEARLNSTTGVVDFDPLLPFNAGETVFVLFK